ncbi:MAG: hypothetical protein ACE5F9_11905 [Phycisphaerae bacterium]
MDEAFFCCYPWDLLDEGVEAAIGRLAGEVGVDAVSVAAGHRAVEQFRPRYARRRIRHESGVCFQPSPNHYAATRMRPIPAAWIKSRNPLEQIARAVERHHLKLRARLVCCEGEALAARYPMAARVDVLGESDPRHLCPSNPDVREFLAAVVEDLSANYPLSVIELEAVTFDTPAQDTRGVERGTTGGPVEAMLEALCFCASCRQRATESGIDIESVASFVRERLDRLLRLESIGAETPSALLEDHAGLRSWFDVRQHTLVSLLAALRRRSSVPVRVHVPAEPGAVRTAAALFAEHCDGFLIRHAPPETRAAERLRRSLVAAGGEARRVEIVVPCHPPEVSDGPLLVKAVRDLCGAGHRSIGFCDYGVAPSPCLEWSRQAIRYARRDGAASSPGK